MPAGVSRPPWSSATFDDVSSWNGSTGINVDRSGLYLVGAHISRNSTASASQPSIQIRVNNAVVASQRGINRVEGQGVTIVELLELVVTDLLEIWVLLHGTLAVNLNDDAAFWGTRVGPVAWT